MCDANENTTTPAPSDDFDRVISLEFALIETRDALRVCTAALNEYCNEYAATRGENEGASLIYGVSHIIAEVAARCDRVFWEGAKHD